MLRRLILAAILPLLLGAAASPAAPLVLAAASLQEALTDAAAAWAARGHPTPVLSFAASSALARQAQAGGGADLFVSADEAWMDTLGQAGKLVPGTRRSIAGNRLVVVAPAGTKVRLTLRTLGPTLARGRVAMADPDAVPAGRYGRTALERIGAWRQVAPQIIRAENVRAALALVERGAAPFGIVYITDARASAKVRVAGLFPAATHPPIHYPLARLTGGRSPTEAEGFRRFLLSGAGRAILARRGFTAP